MTVSRVLNGNGAVSEKTRLKVQEAAWELHYYGNSVARSLRVNETKTIGVVLSDSSEMVLSTVLRSIQDVAGENGYTVITANTDKRQTRERHAVETLLQKHIDGLIMVAPLSFSREDIRWLKGLGIPFVMLMRSCDDKDVDSVMNDNEQGGYMAGKYLCSIGCRRFAFLPLRNSPSSQARLDGFYRAMDSRNIPHGESLVQEVTQDAEVGYETASSMADTLRTYDAVVCGCDTVAMGVMRALADQGIRIPEDILVMGYDGIEVGRYMVTPLTTIAQPFAQIGKEGMEVLLKRIRDPHAPARKIMFEGELLIRESTKRPCLA